jgi:hypothetical protein
VSQQRSTGLDETIPAKDTPLHDSNSIKYKIFKKKKKRFGGKEEMGSEKRKQRNRRLLSLLMENQI